MGPPRTSQGARTDTLWAAYKLRWNRRALLARCLRHRHEITAVNDRTGSIGPAAILAFSTVRDEEARLPWFLDHHRALGVDHFLIVDNASTDGTTDLLAAQPDVSLWSTQASYKSARFGVDWLGWLQMRHGAGHWCLTVDADELLIYPDWNARNLRHLTDWLDAKGRRSFGATMIDLYPRGRLSERQYTAGQDPTEVLEWFDPCPHWVQRQPKLHNLWLQGGVRARCFFASEPERAPTLSKVPLVKWRRSYAYVSSTHTMLPRALNHVYDENGETKLTGALLHTKFLPGIVTKSPEEKQRREHFANSALYDAYYDAVSNDPDLWHEDAQRYEGWRQLVALGLMEAADWSP